MPIDIDRLKAALADRYTIEREIGRGGMAVVYLAEDPKHRRQVAIKVLEPELASSLGTERFLREIETAARLNHPHILPLYDSGEAGGFLYYVMPYMEGDSLRDRLDREGQLPVNDSVRIAQEVAGGLDHAHRHDVVHRDIKPGNILLSEGHAVIADFGIARAIAEAGGERVTQTGIAIGSPTYMSPEQASGTERIDGRADIYALGCVLFEMLAGEPPFTGKTPAAIMARKSVDTAPSLCAIRKTVPPGVERAVERALATVPADRFAAAGAFATSLTQPDVSPARRRSVSRRLIAAIFVVAVAATWWLLGPGSSSTDSGRDLRSIAVLPFENRGAEEDSEYFTDGVYANILTQLSKIDSLTVINDVSAKQYAGTTKTNAQIADELGVATLLRGSVQRAGDRVQINLQLIEAETDRHLWAETYDEELTGPKVFAVQADVAKRVAGALQASLTAELEVRIDAAPTDDVDAFILYNQGRAFWNRRTQEGLERAIEYFSQAIERDSLYAAPYAGLADSYSLLANYGYMLRDEALPLARAAAERALELDESLAEAHAALASVHAEYNDPAAAEHSLERAIELNPNYASARQWYAGLLGETGRAEQGLAQLRRAHELDPLSGIIGSSLINGLAKHRQYLEALEQADRTIELVPEFALAHYRKGTVFIRLGQLDEALVLARRAAALDSGFRHVPAYVHFLREEYDVAADQLYGLIKLNPGYRNALQTLALVETQRGQYDEALVAWNRWMVLSGRSGGSFLAWTYASAGRADEARAILAQQGETPAGSGTVAWVYTALGDHDRAFELLDVASGEYALGNPAVAPGLNPLREDSRFHVLLKRVGLDSASVDSILARYRAESG